MSNPNVAPVNNLPLLEDCGIFGPTPAVVDEEEAVEYEFDEIKMNLELHRNKFFDMNLRTETAISR